MDNLNLSQIDARRHRNEFGSIWQELLILTRPNNRYCGIGASEPSGNLSAQNLKLDEESSYTFNRLI